MSRESCPSHVILLTPDLTAHMTPQEAWEPLHDQRQPSAQEVSNAAFAYCGQLLLGAHRLQDVKNPDFEDLFLTPVVPLEDWECLEGDDPDLYHELSERAFKELEAQGIKAPFTPILASVHSLDTARAKKQVIETVEPQHDSLQDTVSL